MIKNLTYQSRKNFAFTYPCPRKLREVVKLTLFEREQPQRIKDIWKEYHQARSENVADSLEKHEYEHLRKQYKISTPIYKK
jgi:ATP synthase F1 complex assembly factor 1